MGHSEEEGGTLIELRCRRPKKPPLTPPLPPLDPDFCAGVDPARKTAPAEGPLQWEVAGRRPLGDHMRGDSWRKDRLWGPYRGCGPRTGAAPIPHTPSTWGSPSPEGLCLVLSRSRVSSAPTTPSAGVGRAGGRVEPAAPPCPSSLVAADPGAEGSPCPGACAGSAAWL